MLSLGSQAKAAFQWVLITYRAAVKAWLRFRSLNSTLKKGKAQTTHNETPSPQYSVFKSLEKNPTKQTGMQARRIFSFLMKIIHPQYQTPSGVTLCWVPHPPVPLQQEHSSQAMGDTQCPAAVLTTPMTYRDKDSKCIFLMDKKHTQTHRNHSNNFIIKMLRCPKVSGVLRDLPLFQVLFSFHNAY